MIERGLQLGAAMNGWPDERNDEVQGHRIVRERTRANMEVRGWRDRDEAMEGWTRREFVSCNLGRGKPGQDPVRVASLTTGFRRSDPRCRRC